MLGSRLGFETLEESTAQLLQASLESCQTISPTAPRSCFPLKAVFVQQEASCIVMLRVAASHFTLATG